MAGAKRTGQSTVTPVMKPSMPTIRIAIKQNPVIWHSTLESAHARSLAAALPLADIPQITSKLMEIVPKLHRRWNGFSSATV